MADQGARLSLLIKDGFKWAPATPPDPGSLLLHQASARARELLGDTALSPLSPYDLSETLRLVHDLWTKKRSLKDLPPRHLRRVPFILFLREDSPPLGVDRNFIQVYFEVIQAHSRPSKSVRSLLHVFLREYPFDASSFEAWRHGLKYLLEKTKSAFLNIWKERFEHYAFLEADAPTRFSILWFNSTASPEDFLTAAGLSGELSVGNFLRTAYRELLGRTRKHLEKRTLSLEQLESVLIHSTRDDSTQLRFGDLKGTLAETLLLPYEGYRFQPEDARQQRILQFLLHHLGDPRLRPWVGVDPRAQQVIRRWLVGRTLEDFFNLLDNTALDHQWRYRRAFWTTGLNRDLIKEAYVVLGRDAEFLTSKYLEVDVRTYGQLQGGQASQSVLLMEIGGLIIAEWSHNGSCRIWTNNSPRAPKLYKRLYHADELKTGPKHTVGHHGSAHGTWQQRIADVIYQHTRVRIDSSEYMSRYRRTY